MTDNLLLNFEITTVRHSFICLSHNRSHNEGVRNISILEKKKKIKKKKKKKMKNKNTYTGEFVNSHPENPN